MEIFPDFFVQNFCSEFFFLKLVFLEKKVNICFQIFYRQTDEDRIAYSNSWICHDFRNTKCSLFQSQRAHFGFWFERSPLSLHLSPQLLTLLWLCCCCCGQREKLSWKVSHLMRWATSVNSFPAWKCLFAHSVCANFSLNTHSVCANFGLIALSPVYSVHRVKIRKCMCTFGLCS